jgi:hypothetical protein
LEGLRSFAAHRPGGPDVVVHHNDNDNDDGNDAVPGSAWPNAVRHFSLPTAVAVGTAINRTTKGQAGSLRSQERQRPRQRRHRGRALDLDG